jgi:hypothetical protein
MNVSRERRPHAGARRGVARRRPRSPRLPRRARPVAFAFLSTPPSPRRRPGFSSPEAPLRAVALLSALALALAAGAARAAESGLTTRIPVARGGFLATADGPAAAHVLPAAMAYRDGNRSFASAEFVDDRLSGGLGIWQHGRMALGYRHFDNRPPEDRDFDEDEYMITASLGGNDRGSAAEVRWMRNSLGGRPDALSLGFSVGFIPNPHFALAYRGEHLNRPHYLDGRLDDAHTVGLALRPHHRFALATDIAFRDDDGDDFAIRYGMELEPVVGIRMGLAVDNENHFELSGGYNFGGAEEAGYGLRSTFDGGPYRHSAYIGYEEKPPAPNRPPTPRLPPAGQGGD